MSFLILGFITGLSLIFAIGAQNIFVIEQGLKKQYVFLVCLICSISDLILIFLGIFLFEYFKIYFTKNVELIFNILLFIFLIYFIYSKVRSLYKRSEINFEGSNLSLKNTIIKTKKGIQNKFTAFQLVIVINIPADKLETAVKEKTTKSLNP